jgi:four helix bundle protein
MNMLKIYAVAVVVVARLNELIVQIKEHDRDLAEQLKRARSSVTLNISEGSSARGGKRNLHYSYAKGSACECVAILETAVAAEYIERPNEDLLAMLRQIIGTLYKCIGGHR